MSNLGRYQDIVTAAKHVGGVDNLIADVERRAVSGAAPRLLATGAAGGVLVVVVMRWGAHRYAEWTAERRAGAEAARERLRDVVDTETDLDADHAAASRAASRDEGEIQ